MYCFKYLERQNQTNADICDSETFNHQCTEENIACGLLLLWLGRYTTERSPSC